MFGQIFKMFAGTPSANSLSGKDFKAKYQETKDAVLLDVRTRAEYSGGSIKGAKNIDFFSSNFGSEIKKLDQNKTYFVFCASGNRSGKACKMMEDLGYTVYNLNGGVGAWPTK